MSNEVSEGLEGASGSSEVTLEKPEKPREDPRKYLDLSRGDRMSDGNLDTIPSEIKGKALKQIEYETGLMIGDSCEWSTYFHSNGNTFVIDRFKGRLNNHDVEVVPRDGWYQEITLDGMVLTESESLKLIPRLKFALETLELAQKGSLKEDRLSIWQSKDLEKLSAAERARRKGIEEALKDLKIDFPE